MGILGKKKEKPKQDEVPPAPTPIIGTNEVKKEPTVEEVYASLGQAVGNVITELLLMQNLQLNQLNLLNEKMNELLQEVKKE